MSEFDQNSHTDVPKHVQAAKASWLAPLIALLLNVTVGLQSEERWVKIMVGAVASIIILVGFFFAVWAIIGAFRKGPLRILFPATIGLLINGLLVYVAVHTFHIVSQMAQERREQDAAVASNDWIPSGDGWHIDRNAKFAVQFPEDWEVILDPQSNVAVVALSPPESDEDEFRENITIVTGRVPPRTDAETFIANDLRELRTSTVDFQEYGTGTKTVNGIEWFWIEYRHATLGIESRVTGYMAIRNGRAYSVSCCAAPERVDEFKDLFDESIASLRIP